MNLLNLLKLEIEEKGILNDKFAIARYIILEQVSYLIINLYMVFFLLKFRKILIMKEKILLI